VDTVLDMIVSFAATGETSGLRPGMPGEEADRLLGGESGLVPPEANTADGPAGFQDGSLEVWVSDNGWVELVGFDADTEGKFRAPACGRATSDRASGPFTWEMVTARLVACECPWSPDNALTLDDQRSIRTKAGVSLGFRRPEFPSDALVRSWQLEAVYRSFPEPLAAIDSADAS
jgi:hypothetical protein